MWEKKMFLNKTLQEIEGQTAQFSHLRVKNVTLMKEGWHSLCGILYPKQPPLIPSLPICHYHVKRWSLLLSFP